MAVVRTVLGDVDAGELGVSYAHEHLVLDSPLIAAAFPHILLDDLPAAVAEVAAAAAVGVRTMVDAMPCSAGRDAVRLAAISMSTRVNVVSATGLHHERYYGPRHWSAQVSADELADLFIADIAEGIDRFDYTSPLVERTAHRAGVIKVATGQGAPTDRDRRLFRAAAAAHAATGAPILTHCEHGRGGLEQLALLDALGVPADAVLLSHVDKVPDAGYHRSLAEAGAWLVYDQALRQADRHPGDPAELLAMHAENGTLDRVLLGTDAARRDLWTSLGGGPGLAWLYEGFAARLRGLGLTEEHLDRLFVRAPAEALALRGS